MEMVLITGVSGSGKSVALRALEDSGYYCVDNLPPELLMSFISLQQKHQTKRVAIAMDVRSAAALPLVPEQLATLQRNGILVRLLFLDAATDTLVRRYSETRRRHPLSSGNATDERHALVEAIDLERELLSDLRSSSMVVDTSMMRPAQLQDSVKALVSLPHSQLTLVFESFAFKRGIPVDADFMFDVRMLPNPHYEDALRHQTGRDPAVVDFLRAQKEVQRMFSDIEQFLSHWIEALARDHRSYVTVAIGCTGGQHRSVYLAEELARVFRARWVTLIRHRELDANRPGQ